MYSTQVSTQGGGGEVGSASPRSASVRVAASDAVPRPAPSPPLRPMVILDTSVWIDAVVDPSLLKRARRNKLTIAIADEAVLELVAGVVSAATHGNVEQFERRRRACALAAGYSTNPLSPIGIHYARLVGFRTRTTWDVRTALRDVARSRTIESFTQLLAEQRRRGSSFIEWPADRDSQRRRWVDSIRGAFSTVAARCIPRRSRGLSNR